MKVSNTYRIVDNLNMSKNKHGQRNGRDDREQNHSKKDTENSENATNQIILKGSRTYDFLSENEDEIIDKMIKEANREYFSRFKKALNKSIKNLKNLFKTFHKNFITPLQSIFPLDD